jgi:hypothetical protein
MRCKVLKISENPSKFQGTFYYIFFKGEDGKTYKTCISAQYRNFRNWQFVLKNRDKEIWLDNLFLSPRDKNLVDADSIPVPVVENSDYFFG